MFLAHGGTQETEWGAFPDPLDPWLVYEGWYPLLGLLLHCCNLSHPDTSLLVPKGLLHSPSILWGHGITQFSLFGCWAGSLVQRAAGDSLFWWLAYRVVGLCLVR